MGEPTHRIAAHATMSSVGTGYDFVTSTYSPDGRVFQVEYAGKAVDASGTVVGLRVKDGVVFGVEKLIKEKLWEPTTSTQLFTVDRHIGLASNGILTDARDVVDHARGEAQQYHGFYGERIPGKTVTERIASHMQYATLFSGLRPLGITMMVGAYSEEEGPYLAMVEPSGNQFSYYGVATGKAKQNAKTEIEKLDLENLTARDAVKHIARIIYQNHDDMKDKIFYLEMSWVCAETGGRHVPVPRDIVTEAEKAAKESIDEDAWDSDESDNDDN